MVLAKDGDIRMKDQAMYVPPSVIKYALLTLYTSYAPAKPQKR